MENKTTQIPNSSGIGLPSVEELTTLLNPSTPRPMTAPEPTMPTTPISAPTIATPAVSTPTSSQTPMVETRLIKTEESKLKGKGVSMAVMIIVAVACLILGLGIGYFFAGRSSGSVITPPVPGQQTGGNSTACTLEAKLCPDGTSVGRVGPNCDFAPCPSGISSVTETPAISGETPLSPATTSGPLAP